MALRVAIFEDDKDLADVLKEAMDHSGYDVRNLYSLKTDQWSDCDIVLADFRNNIVLFKDIVTTMSKFNIPVLAISGAETGFSPQLVKPFTLEELEAKILKVVHDRNGNEHGITSGLLRKFGF